jgi:hypothetical protein
MYVSSHEIMNALVVENDYIDAWRKRGNDVVENPLQA